MVRSSFVVFVFQDPPLCSSTNERWKRRTIRDWSLAEEYDNRKDKKGRKEKGDKEKKWKREKKFNGTGRQTEEQCTLHDSPYHQVRRKLYKDKELGTNLLPMLRYYLSIAIADACVQRRGRR